MDAQVIQDFAFRDVKAKAEFVVELHGRIDSRQGEGGRPDI
jgi:hypothetical protein